MGREWGRIPLPQPGYRDHELSGTHSPDQHPARLRNYPHQSSVRPPQPTLRVYSYHPPSWPHPIITNLNHDAPQMNRMLTQPHSTRVKAREHIKLGGK